MLSKNEVVEALVGEYRTLIESAEAHGSEGLDVECLVARLSREHDWTEVAAREIVFLANEYGAFMLRNALAIALALGKEDGDRGF